MGTLEERSRKRRRKENIQKAILTTVKVAGLLTVATVAPNSIKYLKSLGIVPNKRQKEVIGKSRDRLIDNGLLKYENGFLSLTKKGEVKIQILEQQDWKTDIPRKWDKKWRMLIFDVKEKRKNTSEKIRSTLKQIGFHYLQDSVWIFPYDCEDLVMLLKADFKIGKDLLYVIADSIENDRRIREVFNLPC